MPTSGDFGGRGNRERESMKIRLLFAYNKCFRRHCQARGGGRGYRTAAGTAALRLRRRLLCRLLQQLGIPGGIYLQRPELRHAPILTGLFVLPFAWEGEAGDPSPFVGG